MSTPITKQLRREIDDLSYKLKAERDSRLKLEGRVEEMESEKEKLEENSRYLRNSEMEYRHKLENEVDWLRSLVENLTMKPEVLKLLEERKQEVNVNGGDYHIAPKFK